MMANVKHCSCGVVIPRKCVKCSHCAAMYKIREIKKNKTSHGRRAGKL